MINMTEGALEELSREFGAIVERRIAARRNQPQNGPELYAMDQMIQTGQADDEFDTAANLKLAFACIEKLKRDLENLQNYFGNRMRNAGPFVPSGIAEYGAAFDMGDKS